MIAQELNPHFLSRRDFQVDKKSSGTYYQLKLPTHVQLVGVTKGSSVRITEETEALPVIPKQISSPDPEIPERKATYLRVSTVSLKQKTDRDVKKIISGSQPRLAIPTQYKKRYLNQPDLAVVVEINITPTQPHFRIYRPEDYVAKLKKLVLDAKLTDDLREIPHILLSNSRNVLLRYLRERTVLVNTTRQPSPLTGSLDVSGYVDFTQTTKEPSTKFRIIPFNGNHYIFRLHQITREEEWGEYITVFGAGKKQVRTYSPPGFENVIENNDVPTVEAATVSLIWDPDGALHYPVYGYSNMEHGDNPEKLPQLTYRNLFFQQSHIPELKVVLPRTGGYVIEAAMEVDDEVWKGRTWVAQRKHWLTHYQRISDEVFERYAHAPDTGNPVDDHWASMYGEHNDDENEITLYVPITRVVKGLDFPGTTAVEWL